MKEIYRDIKGLEGKYQVSNLGNIRRLEHKVKVGDTMRRLTPMMMKQGTACGGYKTISLQNQTRFVHRLVAEAFIDNPQNKPVVNHKDFNRANNNVNNLEWVTQKENIYYSREHILASMPIAITGERNIYYRNRRKPYLVHITRDKTDYQKSFKTLEEAIVDRDAYLNHG